MRRKRFWILFGCAALVLAWLWWNGRLGSTHREPVYLDEAAVGAGRSFEVLVDLRDDLPRAEIEAVAGQYGLSLRPNSEIEEPADHLERADVAQGDVARLLAALR